MTKRFDVAKPYGQIYEKLRHEVRKASGLPGESFRGVISLNYCVQYYAVINGPLYRSLSDKPRFNIHGLREGIRAVAGSKIDCKPG
jgi:hypothetical protein